MTRIDMDKLREYGIVPYHETDMEELGTVPPRYEDVPEYQRESDPADEMPLGRMR